MTIRRTSMLAALTVASSLLVVTPASAAAEDFHLTWYDTAEATGPIAPYGSYQDVIDELVASDLGTDSLGEITPASGTAELSCR